MARALYVAGSEADSGKSVIALGLLELLARRAGRLGVFRPVVQPGTPDVVLELLQRRDGRGAVEGEVGVDYDTVHADPEAALGLVLARFRALAARTDAVLAVGTDFRDVGAPVELAFNARIAVNLAAPVVSVVSGRGRRADEVLGAVDVALASLAESGAQVAAVVANRVVPEEVDEVRARLAGLGAPAYVVPEEPLLAAPTVGELVAACAGELVAGDRALLGREARELVVGAMTLPNLLERLVDGALVVTPGDRADVLLGLCAAHGAGTPSLSGVVLTGGLAPPPAVLRLVEGAGTRLPVALTARDTFAAARDLSAVRGRVTAGAERKVETALALFEERVDGLSLLDRLTVARSDVVTPLMFEFELLDRARADRRHVVLPEGTDERVLRAAEVLGRRGVVDLTLLGGEEEVRTLAAELRVTSAPRACRTPTTRGCASASRRSTTACAPTAA